MPRKLRKPIIAIAKKLNVSSFIANVLPLERFATRIVVVMIAATPIIMP